MARRERARGIALITAMLIAALVTAGAVALATGQQFDTRRIANLLAADRAALGVDALERQAAALLREDAKRARYDALDEDWRSTRLTTVSGDLTLGGRLRDLQGRMNLTNLSPDPRFAGGQEAPAVAASDGTAPTGEAPAADASSAPPAAEAAPPETVGAEAAPATTPGSTPAAVGPPGTVPETATTPGAPAAPDAPDARAARAEQQLRLLFKALELDPEPVQAILDWVDPDTDTRFPNGAEDDYYTEQSPAYRAANRPLLSVRELLLVKGVAAETYRKLSPFVVCLPQASRINVNTAPREVLMSLSPTLDSNTVDIVLRARKTQPFMTAQAFVMHPLLQFRQIPGDNLTVSSEFFELRSVARNDRLDYRMRSLLARSGDDVITLRRWRENFDD